MVAFLRRLLPISMLLINLITTHYCLSKKKSTKKIILYLVLYTGLVLTITLTVRQVLNQEYLPWSLLLFFGFSYYFPIKYLYQEESKNVIAVMLFSWIHTLSVTFFAIYFSSNYIKNNTELFMFLIQTIIFMFSTPYLIKFIKNKFIYILDNIPKRMYNYLLVLSIIEFSLLVITYLLLARDNNPVWVITIGLGLALIAMIVYRLIFMIVKNQEEIISLEEVVYYDHLTKLKNRAALFNDLSELVSSRVKFEIIYMDLDEFKSINDKYGHFEGDKYLKNFAQILKSCVEGNGAAYRVSGDEFICIITNFNKNMTTDKIRNYIDKSKFNKSFLGVSFGVANFPIDGENIDDLIRIADESMYKNKRNSKNLLNYTLT